MLLSRLGITIVAGLLVTSAAAARASDVSEALKSLRAVGPEGKGNAAATAAWQRVSQANAAELVTILTALDDASPLAANWIRSAADSIAERQLQAGGRLPVADLEKFLSDPRHNPKARRMVFEWIAKVDSAAPDRLIPQMLNDPSLELRRDAVARVLDEAAKQLADKNDQAAATFRKALTASRDLDQVKLASDELKKLGQSVDLPSHFGFLQKWQLIGPFDNTDKKGFAVAYPPESKLDAAASYDGKTGQVNWFEHATADDYGNVDLNKAIGKNMGAVAYAWTEFVSDREQPVEVRSGCENASKVWLNGKLLYEAEVYHANVSMDQYVAHGVMKKGRNTIVLKVCQNEQTEQWAQEWKFQLRVCDRAGTAVLSQDRTASAAASKTAVSEGSRQ